MDERGTLRALLGRFAETPECVALREAVAAGEKIAAGGLWGSAAAFLLASLGVSGGFPVTLAVCEDEETAEDLAQDLGLFLGSPEAAVVFPAFDTFDGPPAVLDYHTLAGRLLFLQQLLEWRAPPFVVAPVGALLQPVVDPDRLRNARRRIAVGGRLDTGTLSDELVEAGFTRVPMVEAPGEFSVRGGIVDLFPLSREAPYRIELFDDEIDSIRQFEPATQRSVGRVDHFHVTLLRPGELAHPRGDKSLLDHLPPGHLRVLVERPRLRDWVTRLDRRVTDGGFVKRLDRLFRRRPGEALVELSNRPPPRGGVRVPVRSVSGGATSLEGLEAILEDLCERSRIVLLFANNAAERKRLASVLEEADFETRDRVELLVGRLSRSFSLPELGFAFVSHDDAFDRYRLRRRPQRPASVPVGDFVDLKPGDHIVHLAHGIGIYRGLSRIVKGGVTEEFLKLEFADDVRLFVPVTKASLVQKYVGAREFRPRLSKVGGKTWDRQKEKVKEAVRDLAADLLEIQAVRAAKPGIAYPRDDRMMADFEASFLYEDTPDQIEAMGAIKEDMQEPQPMDRLLCGDVGYGKTELAVRAAFKVVTAGRQVAVLVPTTVLAQQHFQTFIERLVDYPVNVEMLSRFRSKRDQRRIVERAAMGGVDILIGTHRLLSKDVVFADLGLIVVDEEQRFGVEHKTRLRQLRKTVDVLTMTATPIPRTLHMALLGIKDISTLATPPPGRQSIRTEVANYREDLIRNSVLREMNRGGQVFFVHNRVQTIDRMEKKLNGIVPEARTCVAHGQMNERELERSMLAFLRREVDVLVTTTIIESGLDIPNANTIFIDRADRFGLAELHQLRGRVGRYRHRAYCYLLLPRRPISTVAEKRIRAVEEFQDLGAGFRIAMRDLEIRGAGNILGPQQSGHIAAVGYELYCQILEDAVAELKKERVEKRTDPFIEIEVGAHLPRSYVPDDAQRIEVYRKLSRADSEEELETALNEVKDRFGPIPEATLLLAELARVRMGAAELLLKHVVRLGRDRVQLRPTDMSRILSRLSGIRDRIRVVDEKTVHLLLARPGEEGRELLEDLKSAFSGV